MTDFFNARASLKVGDKEYAIYRLDALERAGLTDLKRLPFSIRIVLEAALRQCNDHEITQADVKNIAAWTPNPTMKTSDASSTARSPDLGEVPKAVGVGIP